jgi:hypothetical protein
MATKKAMSRKKKITLWVIFTVLILGGAFLKWRFIGSPTLQAGMKPETPSERTDWAQWWYPERNTPHGRDALEGHGFFGRDTH